MDRERPQRPADAYSIVSAALGEDFFVANPPPPIDKNGRLESPAVRCQITATSDNRTTQWDFRPVVYDRLRMVLERDRSRVTVQLVRSW